MNARNQHVGDRVHQIEGRDKVLGLAAYTHDIVLPGMLYCAIVRSPHASARIVGIDTRAALQMPGVVDAVTADDYADVKYVNYGLAYADRYPMARGVVRFVGEEVAAVVASSLEQARAAARAVRVSYEVLPAAVTVEDALLPGAAQVHPAKPGMPPNVAQNVDIAFGDVAGQAARAHLTVSGSFHHGIVWPVCMETNAAVASYDSALGTLQVWAGTQAPFFVRKELAQVLGMGIDAIHVRPVAIGGAFGGKSQSPEQIAIAALLSIRTCRPVKVVLTRQEEYLAGKNDHAKSMTLSTSVDREGNILARTMDAKVDNGAYTHMGPVYVSAVRQRTTSLYRVASASLKAELVYTNKVPGGSYRGMGAPGVIWAIETQVDEIAQSLGIDPVAYRLKIANQPGDETILGWKITSCGMAECIARAAQLIGWSDKKGKLPPMRGIGIASMIHPSGSVLYAEGNFSNVSLELRADGKLLLGTQTADAGTGQNTLLAQFVAQTLGLALADVAVLHMDTQKNPDDLGSAASRVTFVTGNAAIDAANKMMAAVTERLAAAWGVQPAQVVYWQGRFQSGEGQVAHSLGWQEAAGEIGTVRVNGRYAIELPKLDPVTGFGNYAVAYAFGAQAAEVEVDPETGHVKIIQITSVQDVGKVVNPVALEGQTYGGIVQGIGMALLEDVIFEEGRPVNTSMINYRVPRIAETPDIKVEFVETNDSLGPFGAKAAGEPTINATVAAIANAVADALGVRFTQLPITPERVLEALARKQGTAPAPLKSYKRPYNIEIAAVRALYPKAIFPAMKALGSVVANERPRVSHFDVERASSASQASAALLKQEGNRVLGGGIDLLPGIRQGIYGPGKLVDCSQLAGMRQLQVKDNLVSIGAGVRLTELEQDAALQSLLPGLAAGIAQIATRQVRNRATAAGNLCQEKRCWYFRTATPCYRFSGPSCPCYAVLGDNRHHAILGAGRCAAPSVSDLSTMFAALGGWALTYAASGKSRRIPIASLYRWAGETVLEAGEFIVSIEVPLEARTGFHFAKYARWKGDFAEASAAVKLTGTRHRVAGAHIALGGVAPGPHLAGSAQKILMAGGLNAQRIDAAAQAVVEGALPLAGNRYKAALAIGQARRAIESAIEQLCAA